MSRDKQWPRIEGERARQSKKQRAVQCKKHPTLSCRDAGQRCQLRRCQLVRDLSICLLHIQATQKRVAADACVFLVCPHSSLADGIPNLPFLILHQSRGKPSGKACFFGGTSCLVSSAVVAGCVLRECSSEPSWRGQQAYDAMPGPVMVCNDCVCFQLTALLWLTCMQ